MTAKPKRQPRKVVVWAVCGTMTTTIAFSREEARRWARDGNQARLANAPYRVVRCEGVLP